MLLTSLLAGFITVQINTQTWEVNTRLRYCEPTMDEAPEQLRKSWDDYVYGSLPNNCTIVIHNALLEFKEN